MISLMRLVLAVSGLAAIYIDPAEPDRHVAATYVSLALFCLYSAARLFHVRGVRSHEPPRLIHWLDVGWFLLLISLSSGTNSVFFFFFYFAILVASFRFGFGEGLRVTSVSAALFTVLGYLTVAGDDGFEINRFLLRPVSLVTLGYMIAYWGGLEITLKRQLALLKEINRLSNPRFGVAHTISSIMERLREHYDADACVLLVRDQNSKGVMLRRAERGRPEAGARVERLTEEEARPLLAIPPQLSAVYDCRPSRLRLKARYRAYDASTNEASVAGEGAVVSAARLLGGSVVSVPVQVGGALSGRLFVVSARGSFTHSDVEFLCQVVEQVRPVVENIQLLDRLASEAAEQERRKISRDIHDSTIQPYIGMKLALESLRRRFAHGEPLAGDIDDIIAIANDGLNDLRGYVRGLRDGGPSGDNVLLQAVRRQALKFSEFYGIKVEVSADGGVEVNDRLAAEVFQIVREGLSNVRRHTRAQNARVELRRVDSQLVVSIENDGASGEARESTFTPRSITERVSALGGQVSVRRLADEATAVVVQIPV